MNAQQHQSPAASLVTFGPTGAMAWEIWGRYRLPFLWQLAALGLSAALMQAKGTAEPNTAALVAAASICSCLAAFLQLVLCFGYIETDSRRAENGYPSRLLLKPVSTLRLACTPMAFGAGATALFVAAWHLLVLRHIGHFPTWAALWMGGLVLSFFWWMQTLSWSLPRVPGRTVLVFAVAVVHLLLGALPQLSGARPTWWHWLIVSMMLASAPAAARLGLQQMRQGTFEGTRARFDLRWRRLHSTAVRRAPFASAFRAQFWLEWRRQGTMLPWLCGAFAGLIVLGELLAGFDAGEPPVGIPVILLCLPLMFSGALAPAMGRFDPVHSCGEVPIYITIRPITDGGLVLAKLTMGLVSSAASWGVTVAALGLWAVTIGKPLVRQAAASALPHGPRALALGCLPLLLLLILWTWKNLVGGMAASLTGRSWVAVVFTFLRVGTVGAVVGLALAAKLNGFMPDLLRWLPAFLVAALLAKVGSSAAALGFGLRRRVATAGAAMWIAGGWFLIGLFLAGYAGLVCLAQNHLEAMAWLAPTAFLAPPFAEMALAPLALAWNRHR